MHLRTWTFPGHHHLGFFNGNSSLPWWLSGKESTCQCLRHRRCGFDPWSGRSPEEGNGNPLQYSCLESPMDGEAWWATVHGVTKSRTRLSNFTFTSFTLLLGEHAYTDVEEGKLGPKGRMNESPGAGKSLCSKKWQPTPVFLPGESHEQRSLAGCSPWGHKRVGHNL